MQNDKNATEAIRRIHRDIDYYRHGDSTAKEVVSTVLMELGIWELFDLTPEVLRMLPQSVRDELRSAVRDILQDEYKGVYNIGRRSEEWWKMVHTRVRQLAEFLVPLLDGQQQEPA
jgi:hypothetical protein